MSYGDTCIAPFSHQVKGYELLEKENSFFIAWEQGTGKSKIIIDYCYNTITKGEIKYVLVVAPLSLLYNWKNEILKHQPRATTVILYGSKIERAELFISALRNRTNFLLINYDGISVIFDYLYKYLNSNIALILDESHSIKNIRTRRFKLLSKLYDKFLFSKRFLLSGTPITQSPLDIFTQFYFIDKNIFGEIKKVLIDVHKEARLESNNSIMIKYYEVTVNSPDAELSRRFRHKVLKELIEPLLIKTDKKRSFTETQKQFIWHMSKDKRCAICGKIVERYEDYEPDHIIPWSKGGLTTIENAQITHRDCNKRKSNKV